MRERETLLQAAREKQIMEKLKEKQQEEYRKELARKERDVPEDIGLRHKGDLS